jgi:RNA polymerase sigma factor (sigma-70 family)
MAVERGDKELIEAFQAGQVEAAGHLFERYYYRLIELARRQMGWRLRSTVGSSDLVQSVMLSVFELIREDRVQVPPEGALWPLLVRISLNKIRNQSKYWKRARRDQDRVTSAAELQIVQKEPSPEDVAVLNETIKELFGQFSDRRQAVLSLLLQDFGVSEVAERIGVSERTVYNTRIAAAETLRELIESESAS